MNELQRVKDKAAEVQLSLEALSTVGKPKLKYRPLSEAMEEWRDQPLTISPKLKSILSPQENDDV